MSPVKSGCLLWEDEIVKVGYEEVAVTLNPTAPTRQRLRIGFVLLITLLVVYVDRVNIAVLVVHPKFLNDMGIAGQTVQMGLLMTVFLLAYGASNMVCGSIGDMIGPCKAMMVAIFLWGLLILFGGLARAFTLMLVTRLVLGLVEGLHYPNQGIFVKIGFRHKNAVRPMLLGNQVY